MHCVALATASEATNFTAFSTEPIGNWLIRDTAVAHARSTKFEWQPIRAAQSWIENPRCACKTSAARSSTFRLLLIAAADMD